MSEWRNLVCGVLVVVLPASLVAQDATRGILYSDGGTWLNGAQAPASAAVFPDSLVQTQAGHTSRIDVLGSTVLVQPETEMQFQGNVLVLTHGSLQVVTSGKMEVLVGCISVIPVTSDRTAYDATDIDGKVRVAVSKSDVKIHAHNPALGKSKDAVSSDAVLHERDQATRDDRCGGPDRPAEAPGAKPILDTRLAEFIGIGVVGTLVCLGLCHEDDPISPDKP